MKGANFTNNRSYRDSHSIEEETEITVTKKVKKVKKEKIGFLSKMISFILPKK
jgi:hypothetical protein